MVNDLRVYPRHTRSSQQIEIDIGPSRRRQLAPTKSALPGNND
jgi:hypothetical protein